MVPDHHPRVFISYSHDSPEHADRVLALADRLREEGVDAQIDQYEASPPEGWPRWMRRQIKQADFVLVVCTETYNRRFEGGDRPGKGRGVTWEGAILTQELYDTSAANDRFVPIVLSIANTGHVPAILRGSTWYDVSTQDGYEGLYRYITTQLEVEKPGLGKLKSLPALERRRNFIDKVSALDSQPAPRPRAISARYGRSEPASSTQIGHVLVPALLGAIVGSVTYWNLDAGSITSLLIGLGATVLVGFAWKVWWRLEEKWAKSVAEWIDAQVRLYGSLLFSGFRKRYYRQILFRHRVFNVRGLQTQGVFTLELERVFVDLKVAPQSLEAVSPELLRAEGLTRKSSIWEFLVSEEAAFRSLAVIGTPGSGKTTLLQYLALVFAQNQQRRHEKRCRAYVPIVLFLRDHSDTLTEDESRSLPQLLTDVETKAGLAPPAQWFRRKLRAGKALVLLDGLDEVADADKRRRVVEWAARQIQRYGESRFIVTSRPHGYKSNPLPAATVLEVQPFTTHQVQSFVEGWYLANEALSFGKDDLGVRQRAEVQGADLLQRLNSTPTLAALSVNPLLLTMIAMVHRYRGALPGRRVELYSEICDVLLGLWQTAKGLVAELTPAKKRVVLQPLAFHLMRCRQREIGADEASDIIYEALAGVLRRKPNATEFLKTVEKSSGLLLEREAGTYSFAHLTFQEYLAANHLLEMRNPEPLFSHLEDSWWHEVILLYAAQSDATPIIQACLDRHDGKALTLAYECLQEGRSVNAKVADELEQRLIDGLESSDLDRRKLAAEVLLEMRLRNLLWLSDTSEIDTSYISCAEFQLFIDSNRAQGEHRQPDHWWNPNFPEGEAQRPVVGVRYLDALSFCKWLTDRMTPGIEAEHSIRLPFHGELERHPIHIGDLGDRFDSLRVEAVGTWVGGQPQLIALTNDALEHNRKVLKRAFEDACARAFDRASRRDSYLDSDSAFGRALRRALDRALDGAFDSALDCAFDKAYYLDLERKHALDSALDTAFDRANANGKTFEHARDLALDFALNRELDRINFGEAERLSAKDRDRARDCALDRDLALDLYFILVLFSERTSGNLPAWEGIRIVRELMPEDSERGEDVET